MQGYYTLPPEKLAKAIELSRIRRILRVRRVRCGVLLVLWLLLATGWAAGLAGWTERLLKQRGCRG